MAECNHRECQHAKWAYNHCAEMACANYINKCAGHKVVSV